MAVFSSPADFARAVDGLDRAMQRERRAITKRMARDAEDFAKREAAKDLGGDTRFSGWHGPDLADLRVKVGRDDSHWLLPTRGSAGAWTVAERGRNQGNGGGGAFFGPGANRRTGMTRFRKDGTVAKVRAFQSKRWNGYTRGKGTATRAAARFDRNAEKIAQKGTRDVVSKHFDVT